jgi:hypothetical protein
MLGLVVSIMGVKDILALMKKIPRIGPFHWLINRHSPRCDSSSTRKADIWGQPNVNPCDWRDMGHLLYNDTVLNRC